MTPDIEQILAAYFRLPVADHLEISDEERQSLKERLLRKFSLPIGEECGMSEDTRIQRNDEDTHVSQEASPTVNLVQDEILAKFFPGGSTLDNKIKDRLLDQTLAKLALGKVCHELLQRHSERRVFFEDGSTIALAGLTLVELWTKLKDVPPRIAIRTNNYLLQGPLYSLANLLVRVLYGDKFFNKKYAAYFLVSMEVVLRAMAGDKGCRYQVHEALRILFMDARRFDRLFMTASRFHFFWGPFVGSLDNALFKSAFFSCGRRISLLITGDKLMLNANLQREWQKEHCIQIIDHSLDQRIAKDLRHGSVDPTEEMMALKEKAASRNPFVALKLNEVWIPKRRGARDGECIRLPSSWIECVETILRRDGGELCVYISEPETLPGTGNFREVLARAVNEANESFKRDCVRVAEPRRTAVRIIPQTCALAESDSREGVEVGVWECRFVLVEKRSPANHSAPDLIVK